MFSDDRLRAMGVDPEGKDYLYFKGRCEALGIDEHTPPLVAEALRAQECEHPEAEPMEFDDDVCCQPEPKRLPRWDRPMVKETKQQLSGFRTPSQQRRMFRK